MKDYIERMKKERQELADKDENQALISGLEKVKKDCEALADCEDCLLYGEDDCMLNIYVLGGRPYVWDLSVLEEKEESR